MNRLYVSNKEELDDKILKRLTDEALKRKQEEEETRKELQEMLRLEAVESLGERESLASQHLLSVPSESSKEQTQMEQEHSESEGITELQSSEEVQEAKDIVSELGVDLEAGPEDKHKKVSSEHDWPDSELWLHALQHLARIKLPEFPEDGFPDVPEMEPLRNKISLFMNLWQKLEPVVVEAPLVQVVDIEIEGQTQEMLFDLCDRAMK
ncbi:UNVERIFIED_CONTAM: hypothetical protein K2H54_069244, partial [Gekko kuhli]